MSSLVMNRNPLPHLAAWLLALGASFAQTPATDEATPGEQAPLTLSPFEVNTNRDVGFVATASLAGGRLAGRLQDTPAAYSVLTSEFLEALNLTDLETATEWTTNATIQDDDGRNFIYGTSNAPQIGLRGVSANGAQLPSAEPQFFHRARWPRIHPKLPRDVGVRELSAR